MAERAPLPNAGVPRRHDLDALRAFAMMLGLVLHGALSFMEVPWVVEDRCKAPEFGLLVTAIHGFRMPLFFMLSGYFTAMLWRKRGLRGLIRQRAKRIAIPLSVGCGTVIPLMWVIVIFAGMGNANSGANTSEPDSTSNIWSAAALGDLDSVRTFVEGGAPLDQEDPTFHQSPLAWAVVGDRPQIVGYLLEAGANPNARYGEGHTALHTAAFFGRAAAARLLLEGGADIDARNHGGETPADTMGHGKATTEYVAGLLYTQIDFEAVAAGRERIGELFEAYRATHAAAGPPAVDEATEVEAATRRRNSGALDLLKKVAVDFPFFHHLWFLYFLCWLVAGFSFLVLIGGLLPRIPLPAALIGTQMALLWLVPLTVFTQSFMSAGGTAPGFGPDLSAGLIPMPHVLAHHAVFFGFGCLVYAVPGGADRLGRGWWITLPLAMALFPAALALATRTAWGYEIAGDEQTRLWMANLGQSLYAWLMIFGMMGLFGALLSRERPWVRYLSDSSYWLYIAHLPLMIVGQMLLRDLDLSPWVKFGALMVVSVAILLLSYHRLVRYTMVGATLNGPRAKPAGASPARSSSLTL